MAATAELGALANTIRMSMRSAPGEAMPDGNPKALKRASTVKSLVVANDHRPLDMISFLANDGTEHDIFFGGIKCF